MYGQKAEENLCELVLFCHVDLALNLGHQAWQRHFYALSHLTGPKGLKGQKIENEE